MTPSPRRKRRASAPRHLWPTTPLTTVDAVLAMLFERQRLHWLCRGQAREWKKLTPTIDRKHLAKLSRSEKLDYERRSINVFRSTARYFADPGEHRVFVDDIVALMVLRHYGTPTRILDWTMTPFIAAYFAVDERGNDSENGELWAFDHERYRVLGAEQWKKMAETTDGHSGDPARFRPSLTAFQVEEPRDWFVCYFYEEGFHRQRAQNGAYSMTPGFGKDHARSIARLLTDDAYYHRYVISARIKPALRTVLRDQHGIWQGALYPDSAGAARTAADAFPKKAQRRSPARRSQSTPRKTTRRSGQ
jgi:FRG domain